ncbi:protein DGCR14 [Cryptococcus neoformans A2-102-5]|nr:protein DGCR14 [Cryptococcus neoformans var. grubii D17-1]OXG92352.1 protein DGCR14 [Cryptococcus neoformans var. grubii A2-102-5]
MPDRLLGADAHALLPRAAAPRIERGPDAGARSLYQQHVLDEDTYTRALSHIIARDFFPHLPHLHATNQYLAALHANDPHRLSASIRTLAALARRDAHGIPDSATERTEYSMAGTPYIAMPGSGGRPLRTPVGTRGWDTPLGSTSRRRDIHDDILDHNSHSPSPPHPEHPHPPKRQRRLPPVRDDLSLDAFQRNFTSEDNASFVHILDEENRRRREEKFGWAFEAEKKAEARRIEGEVRRRMILDRAKSGGWRVDGDGRRLIGGLAEGGRDRAEGEAWRDIKAIEHVAEGEAGVDPETSTALIPSSSALHPSSSALIPSSSALHPTSSSALILSSSSPPPPLSEIPLPPKHPLAEALADAGLPPTALISSTDGKIVPHLETASGALTVSAPEGGDRGRGDEERKERERREREVLGEEKGETLSAAGSGVDMWKYKARNNLMFLPDANTNPYPDPSSSSLSLSTSTSAPPIPISAARPSVKHSNTRLHEDDPTWTAAGGKNGEKSKGGSVRASSPSRSLIDAAVRGTPYRQRDTNQLPSINNYPLVRPDASPSPHDLPALLTWGTLLATPRALDGGSRSSNNDNGIGMGDPLEAQEQEQPAFRLPETKKRDEIGRRLADKASRSMRDKARGFTSRPSSSSSGLRGGKTPGSMGPPATPRRHADSLTPAAKRLLEKTVGRTPMSASRTGSGAGRESRSSRPQKNMGWTPTPRYSRS